MIWFFFSLCIQDSIFSFHQREKYTSENSCWPGLSLYIYVPMLLTQNRTEKSQPHICDVIAFRVFYRASRIVFHHCGGGKRPKTKKREKVSSVGPFRDPARNTIDTTLWGVPMSKLSSSNRPNVMRAASINTAVPLSSALARNSTNWPGDFKITKMRRRDR